MFKKAKVARDAFTFSLGGIITIASFVPAPAIENDRINKVRDEQQAAARFSTSYLPGVTNAK